MFYYSQLVLSKVLLNTMKTKILEDLRLLSSKDLK